MSLVAKIPPLVSALAFGYGVGMAAPEGTLHRVRAVIVESMEHSQKDGGKTAKAPKPPPAPALRKLPGTESSALAELRSEHALSRFNEANQSRLPDPAGFRRREARDDADDFTDEEQEFDKSESAAISKLQLPDLGLPVSRQTLKYVRYFTKSDRGRDLFESWLKKSGKYQDMVQEELRSRHLPEDLIWVAMIESGFDPSIKSPAGAVGLWQFMPATGAVYGLRQNHYVDQRRNPRLATQAAAHHLRDLYSRFGQWDLALAAYNMGYEQLLNKIDQYGTTDFSELVRQGALPGETSKYVPKIHAAAIVANNLERFGFEDVRVSQPMDGGEVSVPPHTSIETLARAAGVSTSVIRKLNPDLLGKEVPPGKGDFLMMVPADALSQTVAALPTLARNQQDAAPRDEMLDPLDLINPDGFRPAPVEDDSANLLSLLPPAKKRGTMRDPMLEGLHGAADEASLDEPESSHGRKGRETLVYRVGQGDTLIGVARQFAMDVDDVARENHLKPNEELREGGLLHLNVKKSILEHDGHSTEKAEAKHQKRHNHRG